MYLEKVICQKHVQVSSIEEDKLQLCTLLLPVTFLLANFLHFSQQIPNQRKILSCFDFVKKKILGHISIFLKLLSPIRKKRLKILKTMFYKNVLELLFTPICP